MNSSAEQKEKNLAQMQKSFVLPGLAKMQGLAKWPDAPVPILAQVNEFIPQTCGVPYDYLYRDSGRAMAECALLVWEYTGLDLLSGNIDFYNFEAESAGAKVNFFKDHIPDVDRNEFLIKTEKDLDKIQFGGLDSGRIPYLIEYAKAYTELCGMEQFPSFCAPWSLACNLYGLENLVIATMTEAEFAHELLRRVVDDLSGPMISALNEALPGLNRIGCADAWSSPPMVNMTIIKEYGEQYLNRMPGAARVDVPVSNSGVWGVSKLTGKDRDEFMEFLCRIGRNITGFDPDVEIVGPEYYRKYADKLSAPLILGLSTTLLQSGSVDEVVLRVKQYTLAGKKGKTPFTFLFSNISPHTPIDNIKAAIAAVHTYGAPGADEFTPLVMPDVETFESFLKRKLENNNEGYTFEWLKKSGYSYLCN
jgi:uroporphyrinogen-III decarboxylase